MSKILKKYERIPKGNGAGVFKLTHSETRRIRNQLNTTGVATGFGDVEEHEVLETVNYKSAEEGDRLEARYRQQLTAKLR